MSSSREDQDIEDLDKNDFDGTEMLTKMANHVIRKFADGGPSEAPFFVYFGYVNPEIPSAGAHAVFNCNEKSYKVTCNSDCQVVIEEQTFSRS